MHDGKEMDRQRSSGPAARALVSQRLRLHCADWGDPGAPPLILLHGGRDHCRSWDRIAMALRRDWHVIAPDLRGHGDSAWSPDADYSMAAYICDLAQLVHEWRLAPVSIVAHSLGGNVALRYAGLYPENVRRLVAIEGLGPSPQILAERARQGMAARMRDWIEERRALSARQPRRYPSVEAACRRMQEANPRLSPELALHLTRHGVRRNEDGSWSWKFDPLVRSQPPCDMTPEEVAGLWSRIACPTLLVYGKESWASNPAEDGRARHFRDARVALFEGAGHWVHHDRTEAFLAEVTAFLR